jgi:hypothetical protein
MYSDLYILRNSNICFIQKWKNKKINNKYKIIIKTANIFLISSHITAVLWDKWFIGLINK